MVAEEAEGPMTHFPLRALKKGLVLFETLVRSVLLLSIFSLLLLMRLTDAALVYVFGHWSTNLVFQLWTLLVLCSYTVTLPTGILQSQLFLQLEALVWLLRTVDLLWTLPKWAVRVSIYILRLRDKNQPTFRMRWRTSRDPSRPAVTVWHMIPKSFNDVKKIVSILIGLYWCLCVPIARAAVTNCPLYTERMAGRWVHFYAAFRAYLIRKDIYVFDEKNPDDLLKSYPEVDDKIGRQILADFGIANNAAFTCVSMKAKACFEEATAGYGPLCITVANSETYGEAVVNAKRFLLGQREQTIIICRRQIDQGFKNMESNPDKLSDSWVLTQESLQALEDLEAPVSKMDQRDRLLQVCDRVESLQAIRHRTILDQGYMMEPQQLVEVMKKFVALIPPRTAASPAFAVVRQASSQEQKQCHCCGKMVYNSEFDQHRRQCRCEPCDICGRRHLTKMHEESEKLYRNSRKLDTRSHRTPHGRGRGGRGGQRNMDSSSLNASAANMSISTDDTSSNDFTQEAATKYFYTCVAEQSQPSKPPLIKHLPIMLNESSLEKENSTSTKNWDRFKFFSKRSIQLLVGVIIITLFGNETKSPCRAVFTKRVCNSISTAGATAMFLYATWEQYTVPSSTQLQRSAHVDHTNFLSAYTAPELYNPSNHIQVDTEDYPDTGVSTVAMSLRQSSTAGWALLDTACWNHLCGERSYFVNVRQPPIGFQATTTACGKTVKPSLIGEIPLILEGENGDKIPILLQDCMYMEGFPEKLLLSEGQFSELRAETGEKLFHWDPAHSTISFRQDLGGTVSQWSNVLYVKDRVSKVHFSAAGQDAIDFTNSHNDKMSSETRACATTIIEPKVTAKVFHHRMGCVNPKSLSRILKGTRGTTLTNNIYSLKAPCSQAALSGMSRKSNIPHQMAQQSQTQQRNYADLRYETANVDVHGPYQCSNLGKYRYFVAITAKPSGFTFVHFAHSPNQVKETLLMSFVDMGRPLVLRTDTNVHIFNTNPLTPTKFQVWLAELNIGCKLSAPGAQFENGVAEKSGGHDIYTHATSLLAHAGLSEVWWPFAVLNYVRITNNIPQGNDASTPIQKHFNVVPSIGHFRVPFCPAFAYVGKDKRGPTPNFKSRVTECVYLGPATHHKEGTNLLFSFRSGRILATRDAFYDEEFRFVDRVEGGWKFELGFLVNPAGQRVNIADSDEAGNFEFTYDDFTAYMQAALPDSEKAVCFEGALYTPVEMLTSDVEEHSPSHEIDKTPTQPSFEEEADTTSSEESDHEEYTPNKARSVRSQEDTTVHRGTRLRTSPKRFTMNMKGDRDHPSEFAASMTPLAADSELFLNALIGDSGQPTEFAASTTLGSTDSEILLEALVKPDHLDTSSLSQQQSPSNTFFSRRIRDMLDESPGRISINDNYRLAASATSPKVRPPPFTGNISPKWHLCDRRFKSYAQQYGLEETTRAYLKELNGIIAAGVFSVPLDLPRGHTCLPLMALPSYKQQQDGIVKYRIVAGGNLQREGQSFQLEDLPAPVMDRVSFRILLCIAACHHCHVHTLDVTQAFLNADMPDEVYVRPSPEWGLFGKVMQLLKALYGCRQAPALWYARFTEFLKTQGLTPTVADPCVFYRREIGSEDFIMCGLHSDDLVMVATNMGLLQTFKKNIMTEFVLKDQGPLHNREYLGIMVHYNRVEGWVHLSCDAPIRAMLERHGLAQVKPNNTPALKRTKKNKLVASKSSLSHNIEMQAFVGSCNYFATTCRPDIATSVSFLSSTDKKNPTVTDMEDAIWLGGYLNNFDETPNFGLHFSAAQTTSFEALAPQSYADADWAGSASTARSRSGAYITMLGGPIFWKSQFQKVIALSSTHSEVIALSDMCKRLVWILSLLQELGFQFPLAPVFEDNQASLITIKKPTSSERSRHVEVRYLWTRQLHEQKVCFFKWIESKCNIADHFTKIEAAIVQRGFIALMCSAMRN